MAKEQRAVSAEEAEKKANAKAKYLANRKAFEDSIDVLKKDHAKVWNTFASLRNLIQALDPKVQVIAGASLGRLLRAASKPDQKAKTEERLKARIAKLNEQREKLAKDLAALK